MELLAVAKGVTVGVAGANVVGEISEIGIVGTEAEGTDDGVDLGVILELPTKDILASLGTRDPK